MRQRFVAFCAANNLAITSTMFPHKNIHKYPWTSPDGKHKNQIDHVAVNGKFKRSVTDTRTFRGADVASDHNLVIAEVQLKLNKIFRPKRSTVKYEDSKLKIPEVMNAFKNELKNRFSVLQSHDDQPEVEEDATVDDIEMRWKGIKDAYNDTAKNVLGFRSHKSQSWISADSWSAIEERRTLKKKINEARSERMKHKWKEEYREKDKQVKRILRRDKRDRINKIAQDAEDAARQGQMKAVYDSTKKLCNDRPKRVDMVKSKDGRLLTKEADVRMRWTEHFTEVLNRPAPTVRADVQEEAPTLPEIQIGYITKEEIKATIKNMKCGKASGIDSITVDLLKVDTEATATVLEVLFKQIWDKEKVPEDWSKGLIVKLAKKGDLTDCGNWRGITLMSVPAKIMGRVIIDRIRNAVDEKLRKEQAGFRKGRNTGEQIFVLRNIIEQVVEWNSSLYVCYVDFEKAFDSVHRETLWRIMKCYGIPGKLISMTKALYEDCQCAVLDDTGSPTWFEVITGVKQGCVMSGFLFLLVIDWVMKATTKGEETGIRWKLTSKLEDLDFADDLALISSTRAQIQRKVEKLDQKGKQVGLKINVAKTKTMRYNAVNNEPVMIGDKGIEEVDKFVYLGATVSKTGGSDCDIKSRIGKARGAFCKLCKVWKSSQYSIKTKVRIFKSNVIAVLMYGCETWRMTKEDEDKLDTFQQRCLRRILKIYWPMRVSNEEVRRRTNTEPISKQVRRRRWRWIGHVLRMDKEVNPRIALTWTPEGKRRRGRPRETWRRTVEKERHTLGFNSWAEAETAARNRVAWRRLISGPILHEERRN